MSTICTELSIFIYYLNYKDPGAKNSIRYNVFDYREGSAKAGRREKYSKSMLIVCPFQRKVQELIVEGVIRQALVGDGRPMVVTCQTKHYDERDNKNQKTLTLKPIFLNSSASRSNLPSKMKAGLFMLAYTVSQSISLNSFHSVAMTTASAFWQASRAESQISTCFLTAKGIVKNQDVVKRGCRHTSFN